jgi:TolB-like protein/Flp pilus assembly protein TadD
LRFQFEDQVLDTSQRELRRSGQAIAIEPKVFDLLVFLVENRTRVVTKDDVLAAVWGGRIVSESALTSCFNAARKAVGDSGGEQRLIRTIARKGFRFVGEIAPREPPVPIVAPTPPMLPFGPSIAVLPFANLSGDPEQEYFADGVVEDIITALSRTKAAFVIASSSSFTYKGAAPDVRQVGRELGVRYVLEGSVRRAGENMRITGQLIDALSGVHLWADRFDGALADVFALQDQVTASVIGAIAPKVEVVEIERAKLKSGDLAAYDVYLRGLAALYRYTPGSHREALGLFQRAVALDHEFALAHGAIANWYAVNKAFGWTRGTPAEIAEAEQASRRALTLDSDDPRVLVNAGNTLRWVVGRQEEGTALLEQALQLDPNYAIGWTRLGASKSYAGQAREAMEHYERALRLSPRDPRIFIAQAGMALACILAGRLDEASSWATRALQVHPKFLVGLRASMAANALAGRLAEARRTYAIYRQLDPEARLSNLNQRFSYRRREDLQTLVDALALVGMPK